MSADAPFIAEGVDTSPSWLITDELELLADNDRRRGPELLGALERLQAEGAIYYVMPVKGLGGSVTIYFMPTARLLALRDALRLRTRLNLPTMEPPNV